MESPENTRPAKFSSTLDIPFSRRTWPSLPTAETASRTGAWRLFDEENAKAQRERECRQRHRPNREQFSTGVLNGVALEAAPATVATASALPAGERVVPALSDSTLAPDPPPRRMMDHAPASSHEPAFQATPATGTTTTTTTTTAADPKRLANLFGYSLADHGDLATQKLHKVRNMYRSLEEEVDAANTSLAEAIHICARKQISPMKDHLSFLEEMQRVHALAMLLSKRVSALEEMLVQCVVRDALRALNDQRVPPGEDAGVECAPTEMNVSVATAAELAPLLRSRSFVELELALWHASCGHQRPSDADRALMLLLGERWSVVKELLPVDEANYYDVLDVVHAWGPGWSRERAFARTLEPNGLVETRRATDEASALLTTTTTAPPSSLFAKAERILAAQRHRTNAKGWLSFEDICTLLRP